MTAPTWNRESVQGLIEELQRQPDLLDVLTRAVSGGLSVDPDQVAILHGASDSDGSPLALHHTLGAGPRQAAPGDHSHTVDQLALPKVWRAFSTTSTAGIVLADPENQDSQVGDVGPFPVKAGRVYAVLYVARAQMSGSTGPTAFDLRLRATAGSVASPPAGTSNASNPVAAASHSLDTNGGGGARTVICLDIRAADTLAPGLTTTPGDTAMVNLGAYWDVTAGDGTVSLTQPTNGRRLLAVVELVPQD